MFESVFVVGSCWNLVPQLVAFAIADTFCLVIVFRKLLFTPAGAAPGPAAAAAHAAQYGEAAAGGGGHLPATFGRHLVLLLLLPAGRLSSW